VVSGTPYRIAIVGMGPRGFGCLERLAIELTRTPARRPVHVTLHDPAAHPGAGPIYDPEQPGEMLMNLAAGHVTAWSADAADLLGETSRGSPRLAQPTPPAWALGSAYVPRRLVGAYFEAAFACLLDRLPPGMAVTPVRAEVTDLRPGDRGWLVCHADPAADRWVDDVMCTVGHGVWPTGSRSGSLVSPDPEAAAHVISPPYPVRRCLTLDRVPPAAVVGVRGFALTFVDVALHLTVGRGGRIDGVAELGTDGAPWPRYTPGDDSVRCLVPWSRTGAPLLAKPGPGLAAATADLEEDWVRLRAALRGVVERTDAADPVDAIVSVLARAAETALDRLGTPVDDRTRAAIATVLDPDPVRATLRDIHDGPAALASMRRSVEVALGRRSPDVAWAVGEVWRQGYPGLIDRVGHGGLPERSRPRFAALARRLERVGFGAPADNIARLVALVDAGTLDLDHLRSDGVATDAGRLLITGPDGSRPVDVIVDSVLPSPGADGSTPLWGTLLRRGVARIGSATSGIEVTSDATCIGRDGRATPGLAAIGRVTEGWVLGNDTLNRTLHGETAAWARRVADDLRHESVDDPGNRPVRSAAPLGAFP
jgi:uncharacterized NAD(P)/FAD-binding protein YdhS